MAGMTPSTQPAETVRLRLDVAYDGTDFSGWAEQPGRRTVQGVVAGGIGTVLRLPPPRLTVAGRTDAGVHARGQVCHVDLDPAVLSGLDDDVSQLTRRLGRLLPADVRVRRTTVAPRGFDARFSAVWRRYAYRICDDAMAADPLHRRHVLTWPRRLDDAAMNAATAQLVGEHDFAAFCKRREGATTFRSLERLTWERQDSVLTCHVVADAFCHHMVRSLVGCLVAVGEGRHLPEWPVDVLAAGRRDPDVLVVAPTGLTLEEVGYPADDELASRASTARAVRSLGYG